MNMNTPPNHPTLLRIPTWYGGPPNEIVLPLPCAAYEVENSGDKACVRIVGTNEWVYSGIGPVELATSPAPF